MTCHLSFTKISSRPSVRGNHSVGPTSDTQPAGKILFLPERRKANSSPATGAASVASSLFPDSARERRGRPSDHRELAALLFLFVVFGLPLIFFGGLWILFAP